MRRWTGILIISCCLMLSCSLVGGHQNALAAEHLRINGSGTGLDVVKALAEVYAKSHPGVMFEIQKPLGSSGAIRALLAGALDIAVTSRPLTPAEVAKGAKISPFGKTPLAVVTNRSVPQKNILTGELEAIYSGATKRWPAGGIIRLVLRPLEDIDTKILRGLSPAMDRAVSEAHRRPGMIMAVTDPESSEVISRTEGSIGAAGLAGLTAARTPVNILSLNGVSPTQAALADGSYPLAKDVDFVTAGRPSGTAAAFLDFAYSERGRALAGSLGVLVTSVHTGRR